MTDECRAVMVGRPPLSPTQATAIPVPHRAALTPTWPWQASPIPVRRATHLDRRRVPQNDGSFARFVATSTDDYLLQAPPREAPHFDSARFRPSTAHSGSPRGPKQRGFVRRKAALIPLEKRLNGLRRFENRAGVRSFGSPEAGAERTARWPRPVAQQPPGRDPKSV